MWSRGFNSWPARFLAVMGLGIAAWFAYAAIATSRAQTNAESLCEAVPVGASVGAAASAARSAETEPRLIAMSDSGIWVGFVGRMIVDGLNGVSHEVWYCALTTEDGRVVSGYVGDAVFLSSEAIP